MRRWYGRSPDWLKLKNADAPAVKREAEEEWAKKSGDDMKTRTHFAHRIDMLDAVGEVQEHLAGVEDYIQKTCALCRRLRRFSAAVATKREGHRKPQ
jgi:hypothetical protein